MRKLTAAIAAAVLTTGLTAGCGNGEDDGADSAAVRPSASAPRAAAPSTREPSGRSRNVPRQLRFEAATLDGGPFDGADLAGGPVVFWFWAPWCPKCLAEGPHVAKVAARHKGKVSFVGVAGLDDDGRRFQEFVSRTGTGGIPHLDDRDGGLYRHFQVTSQSSFLFLKADGEATRATGPLGEDDLERHVRTLTGG